MFHPYSARYARSARSAKKVIHPELHLLNDKIVNTVVLNGLNTHSACKHSMLNPLSSPATGVWLADTAIPPSVKPPITITAR